MSDENDPQFKRWRHLLFACVGLLEAPLAMAVAGLLPLVIVTVPWTAELDALDRLISLCFAAAVAWLAFDRFNTNSGVTVLPRRWTDAGIVVLLALAIQEAQLVWSLAHKPAARIEELAAQWTSYYTGMDGELLVGWLLVAIWASATSEELVHRALMLRALEGFLNPWLALSLHALVFELVHVHVYELGFHGGNWFVAALIYGYAFQRTRSLAVPVLMHMASNLAFYVTVWALAR